MNDKIRGMFVTAALAVSLAPALGRAADAPAAAVEEAPAVRVYDRGGHVAIDVNGYEADVDNIKWRFGKMHVPLVQGPARIDARSLDDATVKRVALIGGEVPRLQIVFRHGDKLAKRMTAAAEIESIDGGFRIVIPRKATLTPPKAPPMPEPAPVIAPPDVAAAAVVNPAAPALAAVPESAAVPASTDDEGEAAEVVSLPMPTSNEQDATDTIASASTHGDATWMGITTSLLVLLACGGAMWWAKRRKTAAAPGHSFEVLGNQALGGKSRLVLLGLGDRRMLLAVSDGGTTVVDKWSEGEQVEAIVARATGDTAPEVDRSASSPLAALEFSRPHVDMQVSAEPRWVDELRAGPAANDDDPADSESSAVSGLMELRRRGRGTTDRHPNEADEDRWVAALAEQLRAGDA